MKFEPENVKYGLSLLSNKLLAKLSKKHYRDLYMEEIVKSWLAAQIRALREDRGWSQEDLARESGLKQSAVSRLEDPEYGRFSLSTLLKLRAAFDVGLEVKFVEFGAAVARTRDVSRNAMRVCSFHAEQVQPQRTSAGHIHAEVKINIKYSSPKSRDLAIGRSLEPSVWDYRPKTEELA